MLGIVLGVAGILAMRFLFADDGLGAVLALDSRLGALRAEIADLDAANRDLRTSIHALRTQPYAVEKIAREDLDLIGPGETLYLFPGEIGVEGDPPDSSGARP